MRVSAVCTFVAITMIGGCAVKQDNAVSLSVSPLNDGGMAVGLAFKITNVSDEPVTVTNLDIPWYRYPSFQISAHVVHLDSGRISALVQGFPPYSIDIEEITIGPRDSLQGVVRFDEWFHEIASIPPHPTIVVFCWTYAVRPEGSKDAYVAHDCALRNEFGKLIMK